MRYGTFIPSDAPAKRFQDLMPDDPGRVMSGFVVPIKEFTPPALASVTFGIEFGKRSKGKIFFLFVDDTGDAGTGSVERLNPSDETNRIKGTIERLIARGKADEGLHGNSLPPGGFYPGSAPVREGPSYQRNRSGPARRTRTKR